MIPVVWVAVTRPAPLAATIPSVTATGTGTSGWLVRAGRMGLRILMFGFFSITFFGFVHFGPARQDKIDLHGCDIRFARRAGFLRPVTYVGRLARKTLSTRQFDRLELIGRQ